LTDGTGGYPGHDAHAPEHPCSCRGCLRFLPWEHEHLSQRALAPPRLARRTTIVSYLTPAELDAILGAADQATWPPSPACPDRRGEPRPGQ
jgi:hypothetical protein